MTEYFDFFLTIITIAMFLAPVVAITIAYAHGLFEEMRLEKYRSYLNLPPSTVHMHENRRKECAIDNSRQQAINTR